MNIDWLEIIKKSYDTSSFEIELQKFMDYFNDEYNEAKKEIKIQDHVPVEARKMPSITENRFYQYQMIEGVLEFLEIKYRQVRSKEYRRFIEVYNRDLSSRDAEKFIDSEDNVIEMAIKINQVKNIRNKFVSITKGLETKHFQLTNIIKLRAEGLDV